MQNESPLLKKAREYKDKRNFSIPRKGRIRFVLVLMLLGVGARFYFGDAQEKSTESVVVQKDTKQNHAAAQRKPEKNVKGFEKHFVRTLSNDEISLILRQSAIDFSTPVDTLSYKGQKLAYHFTIDTSLQKTVRKLFRRYHPRHGAAVALDPETGRVLALVSYNNPDDTLVGRDTYLRSIFPAASIFKTITAAAAVERCNLSEGSLLKTVGKNHTLYNFQLENTLKTFREVTLREAFAYSINPVFGRLGIHHVTADGLRATAAKFGFNQPIPFELAADAPHISITDSSFQIAEIASGFNQQTRISPLYGALIAASISNAGNMPVPILVDSVIQVSTGKRLYKAEYKPWRQAMQPNTADRLSLIMQDVTRYGTARKSFGYVKNSYHFNRIAYGGKTGNVDKDSLGRIDWFVGFARHQADSSQHIATGVVTVHGPYWTVHSSFLGAEIIRNHIRSVQIAQKKRKEALQAAELNDTTSTEGS
ncbi:MAG: penicillin-binding transpeptidase domain-containing protein [Chitinispirillaceae bacterium]